MRHLVTRFARPALLAGLGLLFFGALADIAELTERAVTVVGACMLALSHATAWYQVSRYGRLHQH